MKKVILISLPIILIDQIIKLIIISNLNLYTSLVLIKDFFSLTYVQNEGAAFSILSGNVLLLILISLIALILIYKLLLKDKKFAKFEIVTYALLLGGIFGNLIDRTFRSYVVDYLAFKLFGYNFPIFNFADICIVISAFMLIVNEFKEKKNGIQSK